MKQTLNRRAGTDRDAVAPSNESLPLSGTADFTDFRGPAET
jgi:hypothetical protein